MVAVCAGVGKKSGMIRTLFAILTLAGSAVLPMKSAAGPTGDTVKLAPLGGSDASGTVDLMPLSDGTKVFVHVFTGSADGQQARIATGTCDNLGPGPAYTLQPLAGGKSTTVLQGVQLNSLDGRLSGQQPDAKYAVVVERSSSDPTPVACGEIRPG
jgi:hypothetical protein